MTDQHHQHQSHTTKRHRWSHRIASPSFLQQIDTRLLKTHPLVWSLRLHYAAYLGMIGVIIALLLSSFVPFKYPAIFPAFMTTSKYVLIVGQGIAAAIWLRQQRRFSTVRLFGKQLDERGWREFFGYVAGFMLIFAALPLFYVNVRLQLQLRADRTQLAQDMLLLHLIYDDGERPFDYDYLQEQTQSERLQFLNEILEESALERLHIFGWQYFVIYEVNSAEVRTFVERNLTAADIRAVAATAGDPFLEVIARNAGSTPAEVAAAVEQDEIEAEQYPNHFSDKWKRASYAAFQQFRFGFDKTQPFIRNTLLVSLAAALHLAMVALLVKHLDRKTLRLAALIVLGSPPFIFAAFLISLLAVDGNERLFTPIFLLLVVLAIGVTWRMHGHASRTLQDERPSHISAIALALLPYATVFVSFLLVLWLKVFEIDVLIRDEWSYSLRGVRVWNHWIIELVSQFYYLPLIPFAYLPLVPFMKQRLIRLAALPRD